MKEKMIRVGYTVVGKKYKYKYRGDPIFHTKVEAISYILKYSEPEGDNKTIPLFAKESDLTNPKGEFLCVKKQ